MATTLLSADEARQESRDSYQKLRELKKRVSALNFYSSEEDIVSVLEELSLARTNNGHWHLEYDEAYVNYVLQLLGLKQQGKLIHEQKRGNEQLVASTKWLVYATIALAIFTAILSLEPWLDNEYISNVVPGGHE